MSSEVKPRGRKARIVLSYPDVLGELVDLGRVSAMARSPGPAIEYRLHGQGEVGILLVILEMIQMMFRGARGLITG